MCNCTDMKENHNADKSKKHLKRKSCVQDVELQPNDQKDASVLDSFTRIRAAPSANSKDVNNDTPVPKGSKKEKKMCAAKTNSVSDIESDSVISHRPQQDDIQSDFNFFREMLDTIPPTAFFSQDIQSMLAGESDTEGSAEVNSSKKRKRKEKDKKTSKKFQTNPLHTKTVSQIQSELKEDGENYSKVKEKQKHKNSKNKKKKKNSAKLVDEAELSKAANRMQMLQERLYTRIQELQAKRGKLTQEELLEKKRLKRKNSKMKLKIRRQSEKKKGKDKISGKNLTSSESAGNEGEDISVKPAVLDKGGKLVFSKFDFTNSGKKEKKHKSGLVGKDYKRLIEKIEKRNDKINSLKETDAAKAKKLEDKTTWQTAILKAEGERVKDDVKLLKKGLKTKEKMKEKHKKKWKEREAQVKKRQAQKQDRREANIKERKQAKIDKKIKKSKKKGRIVPGF